MKLLIVGHAYLAPINREKWIVYAQQHPQDDVVVIVPSTWTDGLFSYCEESVQHFDRCTFVFLPVQRAGNEVLHSYRWRDVWHVVRDVRPDILLVEQGASSFAYLQWLLVTWWCVPHAQRYFFTWINWHHPWGWKYRLFWRIIERLNLTLSHGAITGNPDAEHILRDLGFTKSVTPIPQLGVQEQEKTALDKEKIVVFVGRLVAEKGCLVLLQAWQKIAQQFPTWTLRILGDGPLRASMEKYIFDHQLTSVQMCGRVSHDDVLEHLRRAAVCTLPSYDTAEWKEQLGHVLLEAMACGAAIVAADGGAISWVVGSAGLMVRQRDADDLAEKLAIMMSDDGIIRQQCVARGFLRVDNDYSHAAIAHRVRTWFVATTK